MIRFADEGPLKEILRSFTYRPGWRFSVEDKHLVVRATVIDTDNPNQEVPLGFEISLPSFTDPVFDWTDWLFRQIMTIEQHEAQEFFKINGVKVFDPHG